MGLLSNISKIAKKANKLARTINKVARVARDIDGLQRKAKAKDVIGVIKSGEKLNKDAASIAKKNSPTATKKLTLDKAKMTIRPGPRD